MLTLLAGEQQTCRPRGIAPDIYTLRPSPHQSLRAREDFIGGSSVGVEIEGIGDRLARG